MFKEHNAHPKGIKTTDCVVRAISTALNKDLSRLIIHSDQGILYQSPKYRNYLKKSSFEQSMSAKGNAYDNAVVESFFVTLKCETSYLQKVKSLADLIKTIDKYIYWYII
jgi:transposase InsO family protein